MRVVVHQTLFDVIDLVEGAKQVEYWGRKYESRTINFCNVHSVVTASEQIDFAEALELGDLNFPDGGPIASWIRKKYKIKQARISGPDFMLHYLETAKGRREKIYLYGNTNIVLKQLKKKINENYPWIEIVGTYSPPLMESPSLESDALISEINNSGVNTLWVSLGCPKQEVWIALHKNIIKCPMLAVGAAFPFIAGELSRAPKWMRENSLEWVYRLYCEPRRLFSRYLYTNLRFIKLYITGQL